VVQPAVQELTGDGDRRRGTHLAVRNGILQLRTGEPAQRGDLRLIGGEVAAGSDCREAEHERAGKRPRLGAQILRIGDFEMSFFPDLADHSVFEGLPRFDESGQERIRSASQAALLPKRTRSTPSSSVLTMTTMTAGSVRGK